MPELKSDSAKPQTGKSEYFDKVSLIGLTILSIVAVLATSAASSITTNVYLNLIDTASLSLAYAIGIPTPFIALGLAATIGASTSSTLRRTMFGIWLATLVAVPIFLFYSAFIEGEDPTNGYLVRFVTPHAIIITILMLGSSAIIAFCTFKFTNMISRKERGTWLKNLGDENANNTDTNLGVRSQQLDSEVK